MQEWERRQELWRIARRTFASAIVLVGLGLVMLAATYFKTVQCDDACPNDYTGDPLYDLQFWVAFGAVVLALVAVVTGYGERSAAHRWSVAGAGVGLVAWLVLLLGRG